MGGILVHQHQQFSLCLPCAASTSPTRGGGDLHARIGGRCGAGGVLRFPDPVNCGLSYRKKEGLFRGLGTSGRQGAFHPKLS
ncbi:hypothetical protein EJB05_31875, partial [Eragrostis curvula]